MTGPDRRCDTEATGLDRQIHDVGFEQPNELKGAEDWLALQYKGAFAPGALLVLPEFDEAPFALVDELTQEVLRSSALALAEASNVPPEISDLLLMNGTKRK